MRYPAVEALTGLFATALFYVYGPSIELLAYFAFVCALIVITFIDIDHQIIPDVISLPGIPIGIIASFFLPVGLRDSIIGAAAGGGSLFAIAAGYYFLTGKEGMGGGDIKLLAMIGAFLGWKGVLVTILAGSFSGAVIGSALMLAWGKGSRHPIPFGPFLAFGAILYIFTGDAIISWYVERFVAVNY